MNVAKRILKVLNITMYILVIILGLYIYRMRSQERKALDTSVNILGTQIESLMAANKKSDMLYRTKIAAIGDENKKLDAKLITIQDKIVSSSCFARDKELLREVYEVGFISKDIIKNIEKEK